MWQNRRVSNAKTVCNKLSCSDVQRRIILADTRFTGLLVPTQTYPYFDIVVGLVTSHDPESYAGGSLATGRVSHARQVKDDGPDKKGYPGPPCWGSVTGRNSQLRQSYLRE